MKSYGTPEGRFKARKPKTQGYAAEPPELADSIDVFYEPVNQHILDVAVEPFEERIVTSQLLYRPGILAQARIAFHGTRWDINHEREALKVLFFPPQPQMGEWEKNLMPHWSAHSLLTSPESPCVYGYDSTFDFSPQRFDNLQEEFLKFIISNEILEITYNPYLKICRKIDESEESFAQRCHEQARLDLDGEMKTVEETMSRFETRLKERFDRVIREIESASELSEGGHQSEMDAKESMVNLTDIKAEAVKLQALREEKLKDFQDHLNSIAGQREIDLVRINRANVSVLRFALLWLPYTEFVIQENDHRHVESVRAF